MPKWHFMFSDSLVCLGPWMQWCCEWALLESSVPVWGVSEYIYTLLHLKYEFVSLSTGSQPRLCPGGFCALVFTSGLRRRGSGRWEGQHDGDGDTQSQDEDPRQHVGGGLGDCQGHTCTTPKKTFWWHQGGREGLKQVVRFAACVFLSQTCLLSGSQSVFMNVSADFQDQLLPWDRFGSCMLEKSV